MYQASFEDFKKLDLRIGTIVEAKPNPKARKPAYVMKIDFGPLGVKTSSAQITRNYEAHDLVGRQVTAVVNFPPKNIAGVESQVLVLGAVTEGEGVVLLAPDAEVPDGSAVG